MPTTRKTFIEGRMQSDTDERLLQDGEYRHALNVDVINSEDSDMGAVENMLSNRRLTFFDVGANPKDLGKFEDNKNSKFYWLTLSDTGAFLFEWDDNNQAQSVVLADTRPLATRVLNLNEDFLITGIGKIYSDDGKDDLLLWTDDNMEVCCINIERAKTYGTNGFEKEDIYLIKKPPAFAPKIRPLLDGTGSNYKEDKFFAYAYRYKYLDGEYSVLSSFSTYDFIPQGFNINYYTLENEGMVNAFNAVNIEINTGSKRVVEIQVIAKQSNSNTLFLIEKFNKKDLGWADNEPQNFNFYNNKIYTALPEKELFRLFDNVPRKAKGLAVPNNILLLGNYLEGYDLLDSFGNPINQNFVVNYNTYSNDASFEFVIISGTGTSTLQVESPNEEVFVAGSVFNMGIIFTIEGEIVYNSSFPLVLTADYVNFAALFDSSEFESFLEAINIDIANNYDYTPSNPSLIVIDDPQISVSYSGGEASFVLSPAVLDVSEGSSSPQNEPALWSEGTELIMTETLQGPSCHTNRGYEVGLVYKDEFKRSTTVLTSLENSVYIPQQESINTNKLQATVYSFPPEWAKYVSYYVKTSPLVYQTIFVNVFFQEGDYVWCLLQGDNKDKVKEGDYIIPKAAPDSVNTPSKIKVLEVKAQEKNFIEGNLDEDGNEVTELPGTYMKIRPNDIGMSSQNAQTYFDDATDGVKGNDNYPVVYLDLGSHEDPDNPGTIVDLAVPSGSYIKLYYYNRSYKGDGEIWRYTHEEFSNTDYDTVEDWYNAVIDGKPFTLVRDGSGETLDNQDNVDLVRGFVFTNSFGQPVFEEDTINGKLFLQIRGNVDGTPSKTSRLSCDFTLRQGAGNFVFETAPVYVEQETFYESDEYEIVNGLHTGNVQDQVDEDTPAIVELSFFNCFSFGNGVESYRYRDALVTNFLNIDTRPNATSVEDYKAIRRFADWTYGEAYVESAGINGLNVFNLSTANFKEGDKQYGSIQKLFTRDTDIVSIQEYKAFRVLFGKDMLNTAEGVPVISQVPEILGQEIPYAGDNGIGLHPESFAYDAYRIYYYCPDRATPIRLSRDGTSEINYGMADFFRDLTIESYGSKKIGGFDPYKNLYVLSSETPLVPEYSVGCGNVLYKQLTEPFTYTFNLNDLVGDIVLNYEVISGTVDIEVSYDGTTTQELGVSGTGTVTVPRNNLSVDQAVVTITPVSEEAVIQITNVCPVGVPLKLIQIVLCDENDLGTSMVNRHKYTGSQLYSRNILFENSELNNFIVEEGLEGVGKFPMPGSDVTVQAYKGPLNNGLFDSELDNNLRYLVTDQNYLEADLQTILDEATIIPTTQTQLSGNSFVDSGNFTFLRPTLAHNLYLVWDYRNTAITEDTRIIIYFDNSGSMNSTLDDLEDMRDNLLKDQLLPFYGYDEDLYNDRVIIENFTPPAGGTEQVFQMLNMKGSTPDGNVIVLVFQDEASSMGVGPGWVDTDPINAGSMDDLSTLRSRLDSFFPNYYKSAIFQVETQTTGEFLAFKNFLLAIQNGTGLYSGAAGLSDKPEVTYRYDVIPDNGAQYYLDQVTDALSDFGINI